MTIKLTARIITKNLYIIISGMSLVAAFWSLAFIYLRVYKTVVQTKIIAALNHDSVIQQINTETFERIKKLRDKMGGLKSPELLQRINPFVENSAVAQEEENPAQNTVNQASH
ncbi:hypothetical protein HYT45_01735 [Candidatus Uhrbacteria bacterium]|nr:hypothetical protein [Candidatus Uhrbacteria bacterium]